MASMSISLPDGLMTYVAAKVGEGSYGFASEPVPDLDRRERSRSRLRKAVLESLVSGFGGRADDEFFAHLTRIAGTGDVS